MAFAETIVLSSSATTSFIVTTPPSKQYALPSSSPGLPSPSQIMKRIDAGLTSGARTNDLSGISFQGFTTASSLLRRSLDSGERAPILAIKDKGTKCLETDEDKVQELPLINDGEIAMTTTEKATRKTRVPRKKSVKRLESETAPSQGSPATIQKDKIFSFNMSRAGKVQAAGQTKIRKGRITKSVSREAIIEDLDVSKSVGTRKESLDVDIKNSEYQNVDRTLYDVDDFLGLEKVVGRRRDWTPPKAAPQRPNELNEEAIVHKSCHDPEFSPNSHMVSMDLGGVLSSYKFEKGTNNIVQRPPTRDSIGKALTKRRKIDVGRYKTKLRV